MYAFFTVFIIVFFIAFFIILNNQYYSHKLYLAFSYLISISGIIIGVACGIIYKIPIISYEYPTLKKGDLITKYNFNMPLMFYIWVISLIVAISFAAVAAHIENQKNIQSELKEQTKLLTDLTQGKNSENDTEN